MKKFVITGASGFIGKSLTRKLLENGDSVFAIVQDELKMKEFFNNDRFSVIKASFEDYFSLDKKISERNFDVFYHCPWEGGMNRDSFTDYHMQMKNSAFSGDAALLCSRISCKKFILLSTTVAIEAKNLLLINSCKPRISCNYGVAKLAAEMICKTICYQNNTAYNTAILASVYGIGDYSKTIQNTLIKNLNNATAPKLVEGNNLYDWVYIDDVVEALVLIGTKGHNQKTYYVGSKDLVTFREIIENVKNIINPSIILKFGEFLDDAEIDYSLIDITALHEDTGFVAGKNFKENILKTSEWVKKLDFEGWFD